MEQPTIINEERMRKLVGKLRMVLDTAEIEDYTYFEVIAAFHELIVNKALKRFLREHGIECINLGSL